MQDGIDGLCEFCQYATGDEFAASFNVFYSSKWLDFGVFWAFIVFNFCVVFFCSWLYLGGMKKIRGALSPKERKDRKEAARMNEKA